MRRVRIYQPGEYATGQRIELSPEASHHVLVVLRMKLGDPLILFPGDNQEFMGTVATINKKKVLIELTKVQQINRESPRRLHLAQAISKGERMEFVIQKAVELGVASITPLLTARSVIKLDDERLQKKRMQWQAIAVGACEQCGRNKVPQIAPIDSLQHYLVDCKVSLRLTLDPQAQKTWRDLSFDQNDMALLVGPEGGLTPEEIDLAFSHDFQSVRLGPRILRTETAALAALSILQALSGDL